MTNIEKVKAQLKVCIKGTCPKDCPYLKVDNCWMGLVGALLEAKDKDVPTTWIHVEDRLPEHDQKVLGYTDSDYGWGIEHHIGVVSYDEDDGLWYEVDLFQNMSSVDFCVKVTHWMPLPEPPKEDKDDDKR